MELSWFLFLTWCTGLVAGFDLGPIVRIAQCRSQCLRQHTADGTCDWYTGQRQQTTCSMCWQYCEALENQWEKTRTVCEGEQYPRCPACQTACTYRRTRVEEKYLPSMLPAPRKGPVKLDRFDVAVVMRKQYKQWRVSGYYPGERAPNLRPDTWIIVAMEDGVKHYSWQEWVPQLESLKEGPLYEATISWKDVQSQLQKQRSLEQVRFNNRVRQFFLEKYGERVLAEWRSQEDSKISDEIFRRFFFRRKDDEDESRISEDLEADNAPSTSNAYTERDHGTGRESYVVSWGPVAGGLMGNQVADSNSAQISLLPGMRYLVRIASNDGPGSFPIEVDTRPDTGVHVTRSRIERTFQDLYPWDIYAACVCAVLLLAILLLAKLCRSCGNDKRLALAEAEDV